MQGIILYGIKQKKGHISKICFGNWIENYKRGMSIKTAIVFSVYTSSIRTHIIFHKDKHTYINI
jgi:hypothetical protein